jgi:hypothetical protein
MNRSTEINNRMIRGPPPLSGLGTGYPILKRRKRNVG